MTRFISILVATDFSVNANNAVRRAVQLAQQHAARLSIVHVVKSAGFTGLRERFSPPSEGDIKMAQARESLRRSAMALIASAEVTVALEVRCGDVVAELLRASETADLIVVGQRGGKTLRGVVLGSTADRLLRLSRCPVLVVKQAVDGTYQRVLVPVDFTAGSEAATVVAASLAPDGDILLSHAYKSVREAVLRDAEVSEATIRESLAAEESTLVTRMLRSVTRLGLDRRKFGFALVRGPAVVATLVQAQAHCADLLVAGKHGRSRIAAFLLGRVSSRLLAQSRCDMLIVPGPVFEPVRQPCVHPAGRTAYIDSARLPRSTEARSA